MTRPTALDLTQVKATGALDTRIRRALAHLLAARETILAYQGWGGDQYGRWLPAVALSHRYTGARDDLTGQVLDGFLQTQDPGGMFGQAGSPMTLWWGAGRALIGLVEYWELTGEPRALQAAARLGDLYLTDFPFAEANRRDQPGATHYQSGIEGLVALGRATRQPRYLEFAKRVYQTLDPEFGEPLGCGHCHHTHGYLCALRGLLDLYEATAEPSLLAFVRRVWAHVLARQMWVTGGVGEMSTNPFEDRDETCPVADWFRLSLRLYQLTGDPAAMDVAEHTLLNHLGFGQDHSGGFCQYRTLQDESTGVFRDSLAWYCCSMHGQRALLEGVRWIYAAGEAGIDVNLYCDSVARVPLPGGGAVGLAQTTSYPHQVHLEVHPQAEAAFDLRLRVPGWTRSVTVRLNGEACHGQAGPGRLTLSRRWRPGDAVDLSLDPALRLVPEGANGFCLPAGADAPAMADGPIRRAALLYGPFVLMVDRSLDGHLAPCPRVEVVVPLRDGEPALEPLASDDPAQGPFAVPGARFAARGCPVAPGPAAPLRIAAAPSRSTELEPIHLVPVAEITDRTGRQTDLFSVDDGQAEGRMTHLYKVRCDVRLLEEKGRDWCTGSTA